MFKTWSITAVQHTTKNAPSISVRVMWEYILYILTQTAFFLAWLILLPNWPASFDSHCPFDSSARSIHYWHQGWVASSSNGIFIQASCLEGLGQLLASVGVDQVHRALAHLNHSSPQAVAAAHLNQEWIGDKNPSNKSFTILTSNRPLNLFPAHGLVFSLTTAGALFPSRAAASKSAKRIATSSSMSFTDSAASLKMVKDCSGVGAAGLAKTNITSSIVLLVIRTQLLF